MDLYHVLNRGTDKRSIAADARDRMRFAVDLYEMNSAEPVQNLQRSPVFDIRYHTLGVRERLVAVHGWCLMGNHYHLLLSDNVESGISKFLQKLNIGYTRYFNDRHRRGGVLFQGKTKRVLIRTDAHYNYILPYIHCNPLDLQKVTMRRRAQCLINPTRALAYIQGYRWSSYRNYCGESEFESILEGSHLYKNRKELVKETERYLRSLRDPALESLNLE